jgi:predicted PilT family ATPase
MNLFELQERLKDFSQEQLVREMQAPTGTAPQFLVLSELQRRQRMMAEEQAQMQTPQTTVAEDAIAAAGVPQGGLADMARSMAPQTDMDMNTAAQPVERMQDGGSVDGRDSGFIRRLLENIRERARNSRMTDEEIRFLLTSGMDRTGSLTQ